MIKLVCILPIDSYLDRTCIYNTLFVIKTLGYCIFSYDGLSSTGMGGNENTLVPLNSMNRDFLERVEFEFVFSVGFCGGDMIGYRDVVVSRGYGNLVADLICD